MATEHVCKDCDHIMKIAKDRGFRSWKTIWDEQSGSLKSSRKDPNMLFKGNTRKFGGDKVRIPDKKKHEESRAVDADYKFEVPTAELYLYIRVLRDDFKAMKNVPFELTIPGANGGKPFTGKTNDQGLIDIKKAIPNDTVKATLTVRVKAKDTDPPEKEEPKPAEGKGGGAKPKTPEPVRGDVPITWELLVGALHPINVNNAPNRGCISGAQQRLNNICMNTGPIDGILGPNTKAAVAAFQDLFGIQKGPKTDEIDKVTQQKLEQVHDELAEVTVPEKTPGKGPAK